MKVYHGSNQVVGKPALVEQNRFLDFGYGFYTTANYDQAVGFAKKVVLRRGGKPIVNEYEINATDLFASLKIKEFMDAGEEWLDFVSANRSGIYTGDRYDLIIGAVADDDVYRTFQLYTAGVLTKAETIERLKIKKLFNQYVFATEKSLGFLSFVKAEEVK